MKRAAEDNTNNEPAPKAVKPAAEEFPRWKHQEWEDVLAKYNSNNRHFVSVAVKRSMRDSYGCHLNDHTTYGQILFASSGTAEIKLIDTVMYAYSDKGPRHDGLGIYFDTPLKIDVKAGDDICVMLTIEGQVIKVSCDRDARFNKWRETNKPGNITQSIARYGNHSHGSTRVNTYTIKCIELSSRDSYTSDLYAAIMHQYVDKNRDKISTTRK
jgi:hypothetical protein